MALQQSIFYNIVRLRWGTPYIMFTGQLDPTVDLSTFNVVFGQAPNDTIGWEVRGHESGTPSITTDSGGTVLFVKSFALTPSLSSGALYYGGPGKGFNSSAGGAELVGVSTAENDFSFTDWTWDGRAFTVVVSPFEGASASQIRSACGGSVSGDLVMNGTDPILDNFGNPFSVCTSVAFETHAYHIGTERGWFFDGNFTDIRKFNSDGPDTSVNQQYMQDMWDFGGTMASLTVDFTGAYAILNDVRYDAFAANAYNPPSPFFQILCQRAPT